MKGGYWVNIRIGIVANEQNDCSSNDSWLGLGGHGKCPNTNTQAFAKPNSCGNIASCGADNGDKNMFAIGYVFAR